VSGLPASAAPVSAYPTVAYAAPPPTVRSNPWLWALGTLSAVLLLATGVLGFAYLNARSAVIDRNDQIAQLRETVRDRDDTIEENEAELSQIRTDLSDTEGVLADAQACIDAVGASLTPADEAEAEFLFEQMLLVCGF
jgi:hypothetical protein